MDDDRLGDLRRVLTASPSRRDVVRALGGLSLAGILAPLLGLAGAGAKKKKTICVDAQTDPANCGSCNRPCAAGIACVNGACQNVATCTPECPAGRDCFEGACTCAAHGECEGRQDPAGEYCVNLPDHPPVFVCGCLEGYTVCAAGEKCSNCCTNAECEASNLGAEGIICPSVPANVYLGRFCCLSNGAECGSSDHCCSRHCDTSQGFPGTCACLQAGEACGYNQSCCSGVCSPTERTCT